MALYRAIVAVLALAALVGCSSESSPSDVGPPCAEPRFAPGALGTQCAQFVDENGRVTLFHGVNARVEGIFDVSFDDGREALEPIPAFAAEDAQRMRALGFNALRLPINWSALEPSETGGISEAYLDTVEAAVSLAASAGIGVLIDMHQDAYSKEIGEDGAPLWAIVPAPEMLLEGPLTDLEERRTSTQVLAAFATFFGDSADGERLRGRFADAAAAVAERFAGDARVIGLEAFNEPLADPAHLDALHDLVIAKVRAKDPTRVVFFEPDSLRNFVDRAPLAQRDPWPGTAYAPHVYTLAFNGSEEDRLAMTKDDTLAPSNLAAREEADSWRAPLAITEFGYGPTATNMEEYLVWQTELQDETMASSFFWLWKEQSQGSWGLFDWDEASATWSERPAVREALARISVESIAGWPKSYGYDRAARRFTLRFGSDAAISGNHVFYVPEDGANALVVTCDGAAVDAPRDAATGLVEVACGGPGEHEVVLGR